MNAHNGVQRSVESVPIPDAEQSQAVADSEAALDEHGRVAQAHPTDALLD